MRLDMKMQNVTFAMLLVAALSSTIGCAGRRDDAPTPRATLDAVGEMANEWAGERRKAHLNLTIALLAKGDIDGAIVARKKFIEMANEWAGARRKAHLKLTIALFAKGDIDGATVAQKKFFEEGVAETHANKTIALLAKGDLDGAIAAQREAIKMEPESSLVYNNLGVVLRANGDIDGAIVAYKKAIELNPEFAVAYGNLAAIYHSQKDYDSAWKIIGAARSNGLGKGIKGVDPKLLQDMEKDSRRIER